MERGRATLSVVVPTWNEAERLPTLLRSLASAPTNALPDEIVVSDGGSSDGTPEVARAHGARVVTGERGRGAQLALGAERTEGDLLFFLHADTRVAPEALGAVRAAIADEGTVAVGLRQRIDNPRRIYRWIERAADARVRLGWVYGDSGLCVRRPAYEAVGGFRPLPAFEDLDLSRRLKRVGAVRLAEDARLEVSARRWEQEGVLRCTLRNWLLTAAFLVGVAPERLVHYYRDSP